MVQERGGGRAGRRHVIERFPHEAEDRQREDEGQRPLHVPDDEQGMRGESRTGQLGCDALHRGDEEDRHDRPTTLEPSDQTGCDGSCGRSGRGRQRDPARGRAAGGGSLCPGGNGAASAKSGTAGRTAHPARFRGAPG